MTDRRQVAPHRVRQATAQGSQESAAGPSDYPFIVTAKKPRKVDAALRYAKMIQQPDES